MNHDNLTSSKQRQRDKLTAKRLLAVFAFAGLLFGLWVLSTPLHQIYWAAQARVTEAKSAVFAPGSSGDQPRAKPCLAYAPQVASHPWRYTEFVYASVRT